MLLKLSPGHVSEQKLRMVVQALKDGGVVVFPTDTVYAFGCDLMSRKGIEKLIKLSGKRRPDFSFVCSDLSQAMRYTGTIDQPVFKEMKRVFPGAFTIIVKASPKIPRMFGTNKKTVGLRIPDNEIARSRAEELGNPVLSTSLHDEDTIKAYMTEPGNIEEVMRNKVDLVVDGGAGGNEPSTVIDFTESEPVLIRQGAGMW